MENIQLGLLLLVVGLATVFLILVIVIYLGKGLIAFVNKFIPEELKSTPTENGVSDRVKRIIAAAVSEATKGKGIVSTIEKR
ncbi:MAG: oxaloacetate decarboxylase [Bacteroidales bacterium]|nr:oxaloacetate decarboxylase [Bacteroidales bacterium]MDD3431349.1 oxaloacetate decarboxylase [Bacteroidales bacterium]MDD4361778.1 oxaloacetate decarboxylase [Bacteroidales bacterium]MDD4430084.1 oxaloacetate decarboxylase [Bacteroidales bacterium]